MSRDQILCYFKSGIQKRYCKSSGVISLSNLLKLERYPSPRHFPPILEKTVLIGTNIQERMPLLEKGSPRVVQGTAFTAVQQSRSPSDGRDHRAW